MPTSLSRRQALPGSGVGIGFANFFGTHQLAPRLSNLLSNHGPRLGHGEGAHAPEVFPGGAEEGAIWLHPATKGVSLQSRPRRSPPPGVARPPREAAEPCKVGGEFRGPRRQKSLQKPSSLSCTAPDLVVPIFILPPSTRRAVSKENSPLLKRARPSLLRSDLVLYSALLDQPW